MVNVIWQREGILIPEGEWETMRKELSKAQDVRAEKTLAAGVQDQEKQLQGKLESEGAALREKTKGLEK